MAQIATMEHRVDIKSSPERFYKAFCTKQNMFPKICPNAVKAVQLVKGDWDSLGSVKKCTRSLPDGSSAEPSLLLTEAMDDKNNSITIKVIGGPITKLYSFYRLTIQAIGKGSSEGSGSTVKVTIEYEKQNPDVPEPTKDKEFATVLYKSIDAYLLNNE